MKTSKGRKHYGNLIDHSTQMRIKLYDKNIDALRFSEKMDTQTTRVEVELKNSFIKSNLPYLEFGQLIERKEELKETFINIIKGLKIDHSNYEKMTFDDVLEYGAFKDEKTRKALNKMDSKRYQSMRRAIKRMPTSEIKESLMIDIHNELALL